MGLKSRFKAFCAKAKSVSLGQIWDSLAKPFILAWKIFAIKFGIAFSITLIEEL